MARIQNIVKLEWDNLVSKLKPILLQLNDDIDNVAGQSLTPAATVAVLGTTTNLPAVAASYADLAAARVSVAAQNVAVEARLDAIELKLDEVITKLKTAGIITA
jgi:hypothetical protein